MTRRQAADAVTGLRVAPTVVLAAAIAVLTAWALRDHAEYLPDGRTAPNPLALSAHGHAAGAFQPPPAILGEKLASYAGLSMFALHAVLIAVVTAALGMRRLRRPATTTGNGVLVPVLFAASVAVASALVAVAMATVLLGTAISPAATLSAALAVLRYAFVLALAGTAVFGLP